MPGMWALAVVVLVVVSSLGLLALLSPVAANPSASAGAAQPSGARSAAAPFTHGDLVVTAGQTFVIQPTLAGPTYYQGGNITVEAGGTLDVYNVTLSFVEFIGTTGTAAARLSHILHFRDFGTVNFYNANLTTDVNVINAYAKLNLTVTGTLNAWGSIFEFPGWIYEDGGSASMTLNQSTITWNSAVNGLEEPIAILGDTLWAPTITVVGGAQFTLLKSQIEHAYADDTAAFGFARPSQLSFSNSSGVPVSVGHTGEFQVGGPSGAANLTLDYLYPSAGALSGTATVSWGPSGTNNTATIDAVYNGNLYALSVGANLTAGGGTYIYPFPANLVAAITATGMLGYINNTGDFGTPGVIAISVDVTFGTRANITATSFQLNTTGPTYNDLVTGSSSEFSAIDSQLGFNWNMYNASAGAAYSQSSPYPWNSNKLVFTDGASGYLANISTPGAGLPGVFGASALLPDASSQVYLYRWAQFNLTGAGGVLPIQGASLSAYYAYNATQANNATSTRLNDIATAAPDLWGYVHYFDTQHGVLKYATTNAAGQGFLLLAAGNLNGTNLPDGNYMTTYHVGIAVPATGVAPHWFNASVSPYPSGVAASSPHYGLPDFQPPQLFPDYFGAATIFSAQLLANGVSATQVSIGQTLGVHLVVNDSGTATITQLLAILYYNNTFSNATRLAEAENTSLDLTAPGQQASLTLSWVSNDTVTGLHGFFQHNLTVFLEWNYGIPSLAGGNVSQLVPMEFTPSQIAITDFVPPPTTLDLTTTPAYFTSGTIAFNGSQAATIYLYATQVGVSGATPILIGATSATPGKFSLALDPLQGLLSPGTSYTLTVTAAYNHRETNYSVPGQFSVPKSPSSPANFLFQTFLGLPIWVWIAIAAAAAAAIIGFLLFARRQAAGKLVECGECGNLIPEDATVCPKCGAEFESDLIRCSRCASTIPADSKFCPECAAQLLGKPGEAESDPEKQAYADFTEKYRAEAKRELGDNYTEGAFWDWWKRQPTYTPFSQWSLQQGQGTARAGMTAPPTGTETQAETPTGKPPKEGAPPASGWAEAGGGGAAAKTAAPPPPTTTTVPPPAAGGAGLKACPSCGKEIPAEYLVCPFCNAVTQ